MIFGRTSFGEKFGQVRKKVLGQVFGKKFVSRTKKKIATNEKFRFNKSHSIWHRSLDFNKYASSCKGGAVAELLKALDCIEKINEN